jgi:two-component system, chemotaxis family, chemotaxis protein CheY
MKAKAKILIVDDNRIIREVLRGLIRHDDRLAVVGTAANGESALEMIGTLHPDLVCLDVLMPGPDGIAILRTIHAQYPGTRVIVVSGESTPHIVSSALRAGASGFVVKPFNAEKVLRTIHAALRAPIPECQPEPEPEAAAESAPDTEGQGAAETESSANGAENLPAEASATSEDAAEKAA